MATAEMLSVEERNKQLFLAFVDAWNTHDFARMMQFWSPNMIHHHRNGDYTRDQVYALISGFMEAFPNLTFEVKNLVAEGEYVSARMIARARHEQAFAGLPATGKEVATTVMGLIRIVDGQIVEHWNVMDEIHLGHQLGLVPDGLITALAPA